MLLSAPKSICFSPSPPPLLLERAAAAFPDPAARSRPFDPACCVEKLTVFCPCAGSCLVAAVRRCKGGDGRREQGRGGRLFEVTDIAMEELTETPACTMCKCLTTVK